MNQDREWQGHSGTILDNVKECDVIECKACAFKHIVPIPSVEELNQMYQYEFYTVEEPLYLECHREDLEWWNVVYSQRYQIFESEIHSSNPKLLDVGSGPGFFLLHGQQRGWQTLGVEPSAQAAAHSRDLGLDIVQDFLTEEVVSQIGRFDAIHLSEVLEHVPDPAEILGFLPQLLHPGGVVCVVVPNEYSPFQQALRDVEKFPPWWVVPSHHINYFNGESLCGLLERTGFEVLLTQGTFPMELFLLMGENYVGHDQLGRHCHGKRKRFEVTMAQAGLNDVLRKMYTAFGECGVGREVMVFARLRDVSLHNGF